jgi:hypothetical protein
MPWFVTYKYIFFNKNDSKNFLLILHLLLIEISRSFPGVDVKKKCSRSFLGPWKKISKFQEFSRNSRSSTNPV